jgi:6-phosphogluconolactonase
VQAELIVADDPAKVAARLFLEAAPRVVALAGGSTPRPLYERLAETEYRWADVDAVLTDERCVHARHEDANLRMVRDALGDRVPVRLHPLRAEECNADASDRDMRGVLGEPPALDLAVLGLGEDGHTASLFPGDLGLTARERYVVRVEGPDRSRLTLTLPVLSSARLALFMATGHAKRRAVLGLFAGEDIPAAMVRAERVVVVVDRDAAPSR